MDDRESMTERAPNANGKPDWDKEAIVEQIWNDLQGTVDRSTIRYELAKVTPTFKDARIATYVPLSVRKLTVERLRTGSSRIAPEGLA